MINFMISKQFFSNNNNFFFMHHTGITFTTVKNAIFVLSSNKSCTFFLTFKLFNYSKSNKTAYKKNSRFKLHFSVGAEKTHLNKVRDNLEIPFLLLLSLCSLFFLFQLLYFCILSPSLPWQYCLSFSLMWSLSFQ